jgi:hypothetical protein
MKFCQFQFVFALDYLIGRYEYSDYQVGQVLCEEPFVCVFKLDLESSGESVPGEFIITFVVEHNGEHRYITGDWLNFDEPLNKAFVELGVNDFCEGHDAICYADSPSYYLDAWPLRTMTWAEVQERRYQ